MLCFSKNILLPVSYSIDFIADSDGFNQINL